MSDDGAWPERANAHAREVATRRPGRRALACFGVALLGAGVLGVMSANASPASARVEIAAIFFVSVTFALLAVAVAGFVRDVPMREAFGLVRGGFGVREVCVATFGLLALSAALERLLHDFGLWEHSANLQYFGELLATTFANAPWLALVTLAIAPGFAEELLCRGALLGVLRRRTNAALALLASSAVFALLHLEWVHGSIAFVLGLYLGGITLLARSLWPAIIAHTVNNAVALGAYFLWFEPTVPTLLERAGIFPLLALALGALFWLARRERA